MSAAKELLYLNLPTCTIPTNTTATAPRKDAYYPPTKARSCPPADIPGDFDLQRLKIKEELELLTAQSLLNLRRNSYASLTIPSSVKFKVNLESLPGVVMARPRSPQKKNDVDHEQLQCLLDQQLSTIRQQLSVLSTERAKMEQKMDDLTNGIKEARIQSSRQVTYSQPGVIRRVHSVETRPSLHYIHHRRNKSKNESFNMTVEEDVDGEEAMEGQRAGTCSLSSSLEGASLSDSMASSLFSSVSSLSVPSAFRKDSTPIIRLPTIHSMRPRSVSEACDYQQQLSPTTIPELPESPGSSRSNAPHFFRSESHTDTQSIAMIRPRANSSIGSYSIYNRSSTKLRSTPNLRAPDTHSHARPSPSIPRRSSLRKSSKSASNIKTDSGLSSSTTGRRRRSEIQQSSKDRQLSYFRQNSLTDGGFREAALSATDDEYELKGSIDTLSQSSNPIDNDIPIKTSKTQLLRRSSLTGQMEHVTNLRGQIRRNSSFNTAKESLSSSSPFHSRRAKSSSQGSLKSVGKTVGSRQSICTPPNTTTQQHSPKRVILLESRETTV